MSYDMSHNVFLSDWGVNIPTAGSDTAVFPGLLRGFRHLVVM